MQFIDAERRLEVFAAQTDRMQFSKQNLGNRKANREHNSAEGERTKNGRGPPHSTTPARVWKRKRNSDAA